MNDLIVINSFTTQGAITNVKDLQNLTTLQGAAVLDDTKVIGLTAVAGDYLNFTDVRFFSKYTNKLWSSVQIPRQGTKFNFQAYSAGQNKRVTLGKTTVAEAIYIPTEGEGTIVLKNLSYNHAIASQKVSVTEVKRTSETPLAYLTRVVENLNKSLQSLTTPFATVTLINATISSVIYYAIQIDYTSTNVDLHIGRDGVFRENTLFTVQEAICSTGKGVDLVEMEKDIYRNKGRQGYVENTDLWYSQPLQVDSNKNYDIITLTWSGTHLTPTSSKTVATNNLSILLDTSTSINKTNLIQIFSYLFGFSYTTNAGVVEDNDTNDLVN